MAPPVPADLRTAAPFDALRGMVSREDVRFWFEIRRSWVKSFPGKGACGDGRAFQTCWDQSSRIRVFLGCKVLEPVTERVVCLEL